MIDNILQIYYSHETLHSTWSIPYFITHIFTFLSFTYLSYKIANIEQYLGLNNIFNTTIYLLKILLFIGGTHHLLQAINILYPIYVYTTFINLLLISISITSIFYLNINSKFIKTLTRLLHDKHIT